MSEELQTVSVYLIHFVLCDNIHIHTPRLLKNKH